MQSARAGKVAKKFNRLPQLLPNYVWMFSFGANVGSAVFKGTGVQSKFTFGAILHKHCLKFNSRVGEHKNVFANVIPAKNRRSGRFSKKTCVHGVIHMISKVDLENIFDKREQCHVRRKVTVETYGGEKVNNVEVYYGNNGKDYNKKFSAKPEARYLKLIYCGGVERNLNGRYLNRIKSLIFGLQGGQEATGTVDCSSLKILKTPTNKNKDDKQKNTVRSQAIYLNTYIYIYFTSVFFDTFVCIHSSYVHTFQIAGFSLILWFDALYIYLENPGKYMYV